MELKLFLGLLVFSFSSTAVFPQTAALPSSPPSRIRVIQSNPTPVPTATPSPTPGRKVIVTSNLPAPTPAPTLRPTTTPIQNSSVVAQPYSPIPAVTPPPTFYKPLGFSQIKNKIAEARRQMTARPIPTASTDSFLMTNVIRLAFYDYETGKIDYLVTSKTSFLSPDAQIATTTSNGKLVTLRIVRANFVNTAVMIVDVNNRAHLPLVAQYPIERNGKFVEMAHYISTHAGIVTPEVVSAGKFYVRNTIDAARENLRKKGIFISPQITDTAERLSIVEHVDH
ncbi:MAG: hypothetical protein ACR2HT_03550, partial [Pyrinomonadaceae bacterium]